MQECLDGLFSPDLSTREWNMEWLIARSYDDAGSILSTIGRIRLIAICLCAGPEPQWGSLSSVIFAVANAVKCAGDIPRARARDLRAEIVDLRRTIKSAFALSQHEATFRPAMGPLKSALSRLDREPTARAAK